MRNKTIKNKQLMMIFKSLLKTYGKQGWWPAKTKFETIVGAILTQNVSWKNAKIGIENLRKDSLLSSREIIKTSKTIIAKKIKSTRFYNQKTVKLKNFCRVFISKHNASFDRMFKKNRSINEIREELLSIKGIGKETADSIILYAGERLSFVSDAYTHRFVERYGICSGIKTYDKIREFFMTYLPKEIYVYNEFHALIVHHCYLTCKKTPLCETCGIRQVNDDLCCAYVTKHK